MIYSVRIKTWLQKEEVNSSFEKQFSEYNQIWTLKDKHLEQIQTQYSPTVHDILIQYCYLMTFLFSSTQVFYLFFL